MDRGSLLPQAAPRQAGPAFLPLVARWSFFTPSRQCPPPRAKESPGLTSYRPGSCWWRSAPHQGRGGRTSGRSAVRTGFACEMGCQIAFPRRGCREVCLPRHHPLESGHLPLERWAPRSLPADRDGHPRTRGETRRDLRGWIVNVCAQLHCLCRDAHPRDPVSG